MATIGWNNYTKEQKEEMLKHIFYYYNHAIITLQEFEDFKTLIDKNADKHLTRRLTKDGLSATISFIIKLSG